VTSQQCPNDTNWADFSQNAKANASSWVTDPPWGYKPDNVFGDVLHRGWQTENQVEGAWIEIQFPECRQVSELWILARPLPCDVLGQDVYLMTHPRNDFFLAPRQIRISASDGFEFSTDLLQVSYFQIIPLPRPIATTFMRITIDGIWPKEGGTETGLGKVRIFENEHSASFQIVAHSKYGANENTAVQAATISIVNPGVPLARPHIRISRKGTLLSRSMLPPVPEKAVVDTNLWIPAQAEDCEMEFEVEAASSDFQCKQALVVPSYKSYFDGGTFEINCTNHNDLGWLDTQKKTADYRSASLIVPALDLMHEYPEFLYTMECTAYLMEFLDRHPEKRNEMITRMQQQRFAWGASYVELLELSAGPEKLVRQFYFGRRWLKESFPGVDTHFYMQTDPPSMSLQMPQILAKAGVKYCLLGRLPFGFYHWESPDGSKVVTFGYRYVDPDSLLDLKDNRGWLRYAQERENYYRLRDLPKRFIYDYTSDYLPPQPELVSYTRHENKSMDQFARAWNAKYSVVSGRKIDPPKLGFTTPEAFLAALEGDSPDLVTLRGDWPLSWAYYDEPSNREALLTGRSAHNELLAVERLYVALAMRDGFAHYPSERFEAAWRANCWPDHGWGGNHGTDTDEVYAQSYEESKRLSESLLKDAEVRLTYRLPAATESQLCLAVYNQLSWQRTDVVECTFTLPLKWVGWLLLDDTDQEVAWELDDIDDARNCRIVFVARDVPSIGYRLFRLQKSSVPYIKPSHSSANTFENDRLRLRLGHSGIKSLFDKVRNWEVLQTDKFEGAEIIEFTALGNAWEDTERATTQDLDRTAFHDFPSVVSQGSAIRSTVIREAKFANFLLRQRFDLYNDLDRLDVEIELKDWKGVRDREIRVAVPVNLDKFQLSYEVPFGTVEFGRDELDVSLLPSAEDSAFLPGIYGGTRRLPYREAINWIDASSPNFQGRGCLLASDSTVHLFRDETDAPVSYPVLQNVLLASRKSLAWNPEYWNTQEGNHRYRMALLPHGGNWRQRYREAIAFNYRLIAFVKEDERRDSISALPAGESALQLEPQNLIATALKKGEADESVILRFYEAEGNDTTARVRAAKPIRKAFKTDLIEYDEEPIAVLANGTVEFDVGAWEIVTIRLVI
jgi:alpha-mannosidase